MKVIYNSGFVPGACPKFLISETFKYNVINVLLTGIYIRILLRAKLALKYPIGPGVMLFIEFRHEFSQKFCSGSQISRGFPNRKYIHDTSHNATESFTFPT
jgi:hypothetical protein